MNVMIKAIAVRDNYFDSDIATFSFTRRPYSLSECLGTDGAAVATGGDSAWGRVLGGGAYDGVAALKSGTLGDSQTNWVQITVSGPGTISFWWKVSSEGANRGRRRDGCTFSIDGVEVAYSDGTTNVWTQMTIEVSSPDSHTLKWAYGKDNNGTSADDDCAWLDEVVWTPAAIDPIPAVAVDAAPEAVTNAIEAAGFADAEAIQEAIGGEGAATKYAAFKAWAGSVKGAAGSAGAASAAGEVAVVANTNAAAAFLLGAERLFENAPKIEFGEVAIGTDGGGLGTSRPTMAVSVVVKDGEEAVKCAAEKVKDMFEATSDLGDWAGSGGRDGARPSQNALPVSVTVEEGEGDTMRFKVTPGDGSATRAFLRVKVK